MPFVSHPVIADAMQLLTSRTQRMTPCEQCLRVTLFERARGPELSIERVFDNLCAAMPSGVAMRRINVPLGGATPMVVLRNGLFAMFSQGQINHVTGDVHYVLAFLSRRKTVLTIHDCLALHHLRGVKRWFYRWLWLRLPVRRAAVVTVISEATKQEVLCHVGCSPERIQVIPDCVAPHFRPSPKEFDNGRPVVLQVGTRPNKNLTLVVEALKHIRCHLRVVGRLSEDQRALLHKNRIDYSNVCSISDVEMVNEYKRCDMLVFASTYEGFGLPIIEAQATGRPVITSNLASMPEVAGDGACFVDPYDPLSIREGIARVIEDESYRKSLVEKGLENVKRFAPHFVAEQYRHIYETLARGSRRSQSADS